MLDYILDCVLTVNTVFFFPVSTAKHWIRLLRGVIVLGLAIQSQP